nr:MAG TPA: signaling protein [Caudoviricetes sp.]DAW52025.1 MAG TPA: signaling protein [Caudoviricetes sp.]
MFKRKYLGNISPRLYLEFIKNSRRKYDHY